MAASWVVITQDNKGCTVPDRPVTWTLRKRNFEFPAADFRKRVSWKVLTTILVWAFHLSCGHGLHAKREIGSGSPYFVNRALTWAAQVQELVSDIFRRYTRTSNACVWGLDHIFQNKARTSRCKVASIGTSPRRKYRGAMGDRSLSFSIPRSTLWWKRMSGLICDDLIGIAASPDLRTGFTYTCHACCCTAGDSLHLYAKKFPICKPHLTF